MLAEIKEKILAAFPEATVEVSGGGGHFVIHVCSSQFVGKNTLQRQRMVYKAIWDLMSGDNAPLHAVDEMVCTTPAS